MDHIFHSDGDAQKISWMIQTSNSTLKQTRKHADIYKDKITNLQSKCVALHVGLFWGIGVFKIKNGDCIEIKLDDEQILKQLTAEIEIMDKFIRQRIKSINQLIVQRELKITYRLIGKKDNLANKLLYAQDL